MKNQFAMLLIPALLWCGVNAHAAPGDHNHGGFGQNPQGSIVSVGEDQNGAFQQDQQDQQNWAPGFGGPQDQGGFGPGDCQGGWPGDCQGDHGGWPGGPGHGGGGWPGGPGHGGGGWPPPPPPPPPPVYGRACFYQDANYQGAVYCLEAGQTMNNLANYPGWNDRISSIYIEGNVTVRICFNANYDGCHDIVQSYPNLFNMDGGNWNDTISSMTVYGAPGGWGH